MRSVETARKTQMNLVVWLSLAKHGWICEFSWYRSSFVCHGISCSSSIMRTPLPDLPTGEELEHATVHEPYFSRANGAAPTKAKHARIANDTSELRHPGDVAKSASAGNTATPRRCIFEVP